MFLAWLLHGFVYNKLCFDYSFLRVCMYQIMANVVQIMRFILEVLAQDFLCVCIRLYTLCFL